MSARGSEFVHGLELAEGFYRDAVQPIIRTRYPHLRHTAALIGGGSEVLGFDTEMSSDHRWGPRCQVFLSGPDHEALSRELWRDLSMDLPLSYRGFVLEKDRPGGVPDGTGGARG